MSVIIYQEHIDFLEEENSLLRKELSILKRQLKYISINDVEKIENKPITKWR
tara:strand:+ start:147 stop:302 length:156 start_codon:yes stop_codon:yes gene_type:complete